MVYYQSCPERKGYPKTDRNKFENILKKVLTKDSECDKIFRHSRKRALMNKTEVLFRGDRKPSSFVNGFQGFQKMMAKPPFFEKKESQRSGRMFQRIWLKRSRAKFAAT